ncbi:hypothetical protein [Natrinema caseinilyticum]|uniref:hypothetical protein n=1 Tax=Natrinema caseinilyticum TaxID=2961570 RepID=UPI0020C398C2|nr:hypothetical protein [Natrinema caseinilyticum]
MSGPEFHDVVQEFRDEVPSWVVRLVLVLFGVSLVYGFITRGTLYEPIAVWIQILRLALLVFVVYLLYRFIIAVEIIAEKL